jgi:serine/threonine protein kinase
LEDQFSSASLTPNPEYEDEEDQEEEIDEEEYSRVYDLPTHISSHYDVLHDHPRTQPTTPVSSPYQSFPSHPLRALTSDNISFKNGTSDMLSSSPVNREEFRLNEANPIISIDSDDDKESIEEEGHILNIRQRNSWDEEGAADSVRNGTDYNEADEIIRKSVKDFKFGKTLGVGSYSTVLLATDKKTKRQFAVKVLDKRHIIREKKVKYVNIEKNTLKRLGKKNGIIHMFFTFQDESSLYFVLDFASNGELLSLIKEHGSINEDAARYYSAQILDAIKYMHDNGVVHRDLKPENILLDSEFKIQVTDFGTAKLLEKDAKGNYPPDTRAKSFVGTAEYVSPELLNEKAIGKSCDIWAFGCILYQMIAGKPPFKATNEYLTFQKIVKLQYAFTAGFPMVIRDLVKRILKLNPKDRLSIAEIQNHHFFNGINFSKADESVWGVAPPEIGPYKISAKSMLPVPQLSNQKTRITLPRRVSSQPSTPSTPKSDSSGTAIDESVPSTIEEPSNSQPSASQLVVMRAKAAVAARKQQQLVKQAELSKRSVSSGNAVSAASAANAATIALSRQPNDIIKNYNIKKSQVQRNHDSSQRVTSQIASGGLRSPLQRATSTFADQAAQHPAPTSLQNNTLTNLNLERKPTNISLERKPPIESPPLIPTAVEKSESPPLPTVLDSEFLVHFKDPNERVLRKEELNVTLSTVDTVEKKFKGKLVDSPLGSNNNKASPSLLSQVANGSYKGLRNMDQYGAEHEKTIITNHPKPNSDDSSTENTKSRFKKFFSSGGSNDDHSTGKRNRTIVITNTGRILIFDINSETDKLDLKTEINLSHPVIRVKELIQSSASPNATKAFVIESYSTAFVFEGQQSKISAWTQTIHRVRSGKKEPYTKPERDSRSTSIAVPDVLTGTSSIDTSQSSQFKAEKPSREESYSAASGSSHEVKRPTSKSSTKGNNSRTGMFKEMVRSKGTSRTHSTKELPGNGQLYHGLPMKLFIGDKTLADPSLIAASAAAASSQSHDSSHAEVEGRSSFTDKTYGELPSSPNSNATPKVITGMNSRMLTRSHDRKKKK